MTNNTKSGWAPGIAGKTALVTGAGRMHSIGRAVAVELARQGANVVVTGTGRHPDHYPPEERAAGWRDIESVTDEIERLGVQAMAIVSDVRDEHAVTGMVESVIKRFGGIDILVNNAGAARGGDRGPIVDMPFDQWSRVLRVNLDGVFLTSQAVTRHMIARGKGGSVVNVSSIASRNASPGNGAYTASKAAVNALSRTMALELAEHGIRVNSVLPGIIDTSRTADIGRDEVWNDFVAQFTPLGVAGKASEVADLCVYLCSDRAKWITGQDFAIDGGSTWH